MVWYFIVLVGGIRSLNRLGLSGCVLRLFRRQSAWLFCTSGCSECKHILFKEALVDKFFQVLPQTSAVDDLVSFAFMKETILFHSECRVVLDRHRAPYPRLVLDGIEDLIDGKPQRGEVLFHLEDSGWIRREDRERLSFACWLPTIRVTGMGWSFMP